MTKFYQDKNPPRVWDRDRNKVTVVFQNGEFDTDDTAIIDLLVRVGYRNNGVLTESKSDKEDQEALREEHTKLVRRKNEPGKTN